MNVYPVISFEYDIKPLFRHFDRNSMLEVADLDLWSYDDHLKNYDKIFKQVSSGKMPCDKPWTRDMVEIYAYWIDSGMQP